MAAVKELIVEEGITLSNELLEDILSTLYYNAQIDFCTVVYIVLEEVMLDRLRETFIEEILYTPLAGFQHRCIRQSALEKDADIKLIYGSNCDACATQNGLCH